MATKIRGNQDGTNGRNESYTVHGRGNVSRAKIVQEIKSGQHPRHSVYERNGQEYIRSNPDQTTNNNVNNSD